MATPSIRECLLQLAALHDTPKVIADLSELRETDGQPWPEIDRALSRLADLQALAGHLAGYVRNPGTPPTAPATNPLRHKSIP